MLTRYFVLYLGWTLEFMLRMWRIGPTGPPRSEESANLLYDSCTNAEILARAPDYVVDEDGIEMNAFFQAYARVPLRFPSQSTPKETSP